MANNVFSRKRVQAGVDGILEDSREWLTRAEAMDEFGDDVAFSNLGWVLLDELASFVSYYLNSAEVTDEHYAAASEIFAAYEALEAQVIPGRFSPFHGDDVDFDSLCWENMGDMTRILSTISAS